jgi:predicted MFS family arabinose efflux permease
VTRQASLSQFRTFSIFKTALFYVPILVIYLKQVVENPVQIAYLLSIKTIVALIFEIPTGIIADHVGRKTSVMISLLLTTVSLSIFLSSTNYHLLLAAQALFGLAETFDSGAFTAFLHDNLIAEDRAATFDQALRDMSFWSSNALFVAFIIGSFAFSRDTHLPFLLTLISMFVAIALLTTIREHNYEPARRHGKAKQEIFLLLRRAVDDSRAMSEFLVASAFINGIFYASYLFLVPLILKSAGVADRYFGLIFALAVFAFGFGAKRSDRIGNNRKFLNTTAPLLAFCAFVALGFFSGGIACALLVIFLRFIWGAFNVILGIELNRMVASSAARASVLSVSSALESGISSLLMILFGWMISGWPLWVTELCIGGLFLAGGFALSLRAVPALKIR